MDIKTISDLTEIQGWMVAVPTGSKKRFAVGVNYFSEDSVEIGKFEFQGSVGFRFRLSVGNQHPGNWKVGSFSDVISDLKEAIA